MHLLLVRHGETEWNVERRIQGWTNSPMTVRGRDQAAALGRRLLAVPLAAVYCSPSQRTIETAKAAVDGRPTIPFHVEDELKETSWGRWEGKTADEISADEPDLWAAFVARGHEYPGPDESDWEATSVVPGGETLLEASRRINSGVASIVERYRDTDDWVMVVGHGGSLRFVIAAMLGLRPAASRSFHLDNASITHIVVNNRRSILKLLNDSSHWSEEILP